jgi:hypothetical protein
MTPKAFWGGHKSLRGAHCLKQMDNPIMDGTNTDINHNPLQK